MDRRMRRQAAARRRRLALAAGIVVAVVAVAGAWVLVGAIMSGGGTAQAARSQQRRATTESTTTSTSSTTTTTTTTTILPTPVAIQGGSVAPIISRVPTSTPVVFFTIDDGQVRDPAVIDFLRDHHIPVTMFPIPAYVHQDQAYFDAIHSLGASAQD